MRKKSENIVTSELCEYGCGNLALFKNQSGRLTCCQNSSSCQAIKMKNGIGVKKNHRNQKEIYAALPQEKKDRMAWNRGNISADFSYNGKGSHKRVLIDERGHQCECCFNKIWMENPIPLELEHIDGDNKNNDKNNLKLLCPNCHAFTPTYRGRGINNGSKKVSDENLIEALRNSKNIRQALLKVGLVAKARNYDRCKRLLNIAGLAELVDASSLNLEDN